MTFLGRNTCKYRLDMYRNLNIECEQWTWLSTMRIFRAIALLWGYTPRMQFAHVSGLWWRSLVGNFTQSCGHKLRAVTIRIKHHIKSKKLWINYETITHPLAISKLLINFLIFHISTLRSADDSSDILDRINFTLQTNKTLKRTDKSSK